MIYFIRDTSSGHVKIGYAADPWSRFSKIQSDCPGKLEMCGVEPGGVQREAELHLRFATSRSRGEWFCGTPELGDYMATLERLERPAAGRKSKAFWGGFSDEEVAVAAGVHRSMVSKYRLGYRRPTAETAVAIQRLTGKSAIELVFGENAAEALAAHALTMQRAA